MALWVEHYRRIHGASFDRLDEYLPEIQTQSKHGRRKKPVPAFSDAQGGLDDRQPSMQGGWTDPLDQLTDRLAQPGRLK